MGQLIQIEHLVKRYFGDGAAGSRKTVSALDDISFSLVPGNTLALVGESGSGKSTLALCLAGLERPTSGSIWFEARDIAALDESALRAVRPQIQLVFQDPATSLNPRFTVLEILTEPIIVQRKAGARESVERAFALLDQVGLSSAVANRKSAELSGGQKQRLAIARALALTPKLLILDESLSGLDCSVQAQIANLLMELQSAFGLTYLFITHDLAMAAHMGDEIAVLDRGRIAEHGVPEKVLRFPEQEATRRLIEAVPGANLPPRLSRVL